MVNSQFSCYEKLREKNQVRQYDGLFVISEDGNSIVIVLWFQDMFIPTCGCFLVRDFTYLPDHLWFQGMFIVSLPFAVLRGGYWAIAAMIGIAHICCYTGKILVECLYELDLATGTFLISLTNVTYVSKYLNLTIWEGILIPSSRAFLALTLESKKLLWASRLHKYESSGVPEHSQYSHDKKKYTKVLASIGIFYTRQGLWMVEVVSLKWSMVSRRRHCP